MDELILLNRIRVDIGNVSGSISELLQYAGMAGFNDNYEPQTKPRLVGTWTINDWYTQEQLEQARAAFDGLTVVGDPNYVIDFSQMAIQVLDPNKDNYNPAMAIILQAAGYGNTLDEPPIQGQTGRWFINKSEWSILGIRIENFTTQVSDSNNIVSNLTETFTQTFLNFKDVRTCSVQDWTGKNFNCPIVVPSSFTGSYNGGFYNYNFKYMIWLLSSHLTTVGYFISGSYPILVGYGHSKYEQENIKKSWGNVLKGIIKTWYEYTTPKVTFDGTNVTIITGRTSTIYYTIDGSTPTELSIAYTQPFSWDGQGVIKAIAVEPNITTTEFKSSEVVEFYNQTVDTPQVSYTSNSISVVCGTQGATIYYTTDGTIPTYESSIIYDTIPISEDIVEFKCIAVKEGFNDSKLVTKVCILNSTLWGSDENSSAFAIQCIDSSKPNYNPGLCIVIQPYYGIGGESDSPTNGNYVLLKTDASNINPIGLFNGKASVVDNNKIVNNQKQTFNQTILDFKYFGITSINDWALQSTNFNCPMILPYVLRTLNQSFTFSNFSYIHILAIDPPTGTISQYTFSNSYKIYVGDGSSASHDDAILADYVAVSGWSSYASRLDTWYNYLHPQV